MLCPIHELVTGQVDETARQPLHFDVFSLPTVYLSLPAFSALFCLPVVSHVVLEVTHLTVLVKVTGSNFVQILNIPKSYFLNYLNEISSHVLESLFRGSNIALQISLHRMSFFLTTPLSLSKLKTSMLWIQT